MQNIRDALFLLLLVVMTAEALIEAAAPSALSGLAPVLSPRTAETIRLLGATLLLAGLALFVVAQAHLGPSWRIGIDERARPGLVTSGMYRFCRNPIFLFMETVFVGFADEYRAYTQRVGRFFPWIGRLHE